MEDGNSEGIEVRVLMERSKVNVILKGSGCKGMNGFYEYHLIFIFPGIIIFFLSGIPV